MQQMNGIWIHEMKYTLHGRVLEWGPANASTLLDTTTTNSVPLVIAWRILQVDAYITGGAPRFGFENGVWQWYHRFWVKEWAAVREVFDRFLGTAGLYERVAFVVECWYRTQEAGWEVDDQI